MSHNYSKAEPVFTAIGHLCMVWASLDRAANMVIEAALGISAEQANCIAMQVDPVAGRMKLLKTLVVTTSQPDDWKARATWLFNRIGDSLAARRNRIVHDSWDFKGTIPRQIDRRVKVSQPQSRLPPQIITDTHSDVSASDIRDLIDEVSICAVGLLCVKTDLDFSREESAPLPLESSSLGMLDITRLLQRESPPEGPQAGTTHPPR